MSRNALMLGGLGAVVLALLVGLWLLLMKGEDKPAASNEPAAKPIVGSAAPQGGTTTAPGSVTPTPATPSGSGDSPREYDVGGTRVRDHRSGERKPLDVPPNVHQPGGHSIQSTTTNAVSQKLLDVLRDCMASVPAAARGEKPRLEGQVLIAIKGGKVTVTSATMQLRKIADDAAGPAKQCLEQKSVGQQAIATGEPDVENYSINISFAIP